MDVDSALSRFSQVVHHRQSHGGVTLAAEGGGVGASSVEKSRQERLEMLKISSRDLQSKIASASAEISTKPGQWKYTASLV